MATQLKNPGPIEYEAVIKEVPLRQGGSATGLEFNYDLKETFGKGNLVPVIITFDDRVKYQGSLAKMSQGPYASILLRKDKREELGKGPGDKVRVRVELDTSERKVELANDEEQALKEADLLDKFQSLAFTHQREYHRWIEEAKRPETRAARIAKMCEMLAAGRKEPR